MVGTGPGPCSREDRATSYVVSTRTPRFVVCMPKRRRSPTVANKICEDCERIAHRFCEDCENAGGGRHQRSRVEAGLTAMAVATGTRVIGVSEKNACWGVSLSLAYPQFEQMLTELWSQPNVFGYASAPSDSSSAPLFAAGETSPS